MYSSAFSGMKSKFIFPAGALIAGVLLGFVAGRSGGVRDAHPLHSESLGAAGAPRRTSQTATAQFGKSSSGGDVSRRGSSGNRNMRELYSGMDKAQLADAAARLEYLPPAERMAETLMLYGAWAEVDPLAALSHAGRMGPAGEAARQEVLRSWANYEPSAAAEWFKTNKARFSPEQRTGDASGAATERMNAASVIGRAWARQDAEAALSWASSLEGDFHRSVDAVISEIAKGDPTEAVRLAGGLESGGSARTREVIAIQWAAVDFAATDAWIRTLPAAEQAGLRSRAISALSVTDPQAAARAFDALPDGEGKERGVADLVKSWASKDFHEAERWLSAQESDSVKKSGIESLIAEITATDPSAARTLLDSVAPGIVKDGALASYIRSSAPARPESLLVLVDGISNDADRWQSLAWVMSRWKEEDPKAAELYLQQNFSENKSAR
jgi:hypothetical protein